MQSPGRRRLRSPSDDSDDAPDDAPLVLKTIMFDFWGEQVPHVTLPDGAVNVVLQEAIRTFSGITDSGVLARDTKKSIGAVKTGNTAHVQ